jgi:hypothetical protein
MASTIDLRQGGITTQARKPMMENDSVYIIRQRIDATDLSQYLATLAASTHLVSGNTYQFIAIPPYSILTRASILVYTVDTGSGTSTLTDGTAVPLAAQIMTTAGIFAGVTSMPKYYGASGGYIAGLIASADITIAVFDVILELIDVLWNMSAGSSGTGQ